MSSLIDPIACFLTELHSGRFAPVLERPVPIIPFNGYPLGESREIRFLQALNRPPERSRVIAFGRCNMRCPGCYRDAQYIDDDFNVAGAVDVSLGTVLVLVRQAIDSGETIRLSGGEPSMHMAESLILADFVRAHGGKLSYCHNGSAPGFVKRLNPYVAHAAIDIKGMRVSDFVRRTGVAGRHATIMMGNAIQSLAVLADGRVLTDVRTTVYGDTEFDDLETIAQTIVSVTKCQRIFWTIRNYDPVEGLDWRSMPQSTLLDWIEKVSRRYPNLPIGYRGTWENGQLICMQAGRLTLL